MLSLLSASPYVQGGAEQVMKALEETGKLEEAAPTAVKRAKRVARQMEEALTPVDSSDKNKATSQKGRGAAATKKAGDRIPSFDFRL